MQVCEGSESEETLAEIVLGVCARDPARGVFGDACFFCSALAVYRSTGRELVHTADCAHQKMLAHCDVWISLAAVCRLVAKIRLRGAR